MPKFHSILIPLVLAIFLSACDSRNKANQLPNVSGAVTKGVMANAVVSLYRISGPNTPADLLGTTRSDEHGEFSIHLDAGDGPILVQATADDATRMTCDLSQGCLSASTQQWYTFGEKMPVEADFQLLGVLQKRPAGNLVAHISPISHLIVSTAFNLPDGLTTENLSTASEWVTQALGLESDPLTTPNIDITSTEQLHSASIESTKQSLMAAGFFDLIQGEAWKDAEITVNNIDLSPVMATASQLITDLNASFPLAAASELQRFSESQAALATTSSLEVISAPRSMSVTEGEAFYFRIHAVSNQPLQYQWFRDGQIIEGANEPLFGRSSSVLGDAGRYQVRVDDGTESYFSHSARLWVNEELSELEVTQNPESQWLVSGQSLTLSVQANVSNGVEILWQRNGSILPEFSGTTLHISSVSEIDAGDYRAIVTDGETLLYSEFAKVVVEATTSELSILEHPQSITLLIGQSANFSTKVLGDGFITYQWYKDGQELTGQTNESLYLPSVLEENEGSYSVRAMNSQGSMMSASATLTVVSDTLSLELLEEPQDADLYVGESAVLRVTALGGTHFSYQWYKDGSPIVGATENQLNIVAENTSVSGQYSVIVTNQYGTIQSQAAAVSVSEAPTLALSWSMPSERENGDSLPPHEISGYLLEHRSNTPDSVQRIQIDGANNTVYTLRNLKRGELYLRIATIDSDGLVGRFSAPVSLMLP